MVLAWLAAGAAAAQPPIWIVHGRHATVVLFGSVHLLPPGLAWRPAELDKALNRADDLWFEIPTDSAAELAASRAALKLGLQPPGQSLEATLTPADREHLARAARDCGLPVDGLDHLKPWLADVTLSVAAYRQAGATPEDGVEHQIVTTTPARVVRRAFETPAEQIGILAGSSLSDQIASLEETLSEIDQGRAAYDRLVAAWMSGDTKALAHETLDPMIRTAPGVYRTLVVDRSRRWVGVIRHRLEGRGVAVIVVGVGHLIGPDGVPAQLRAEGIEVDGP